MKDMLPEMHPTLRELVELSARRKWMSYEELNTTLPDEMVDPEKIDELLVVGPGLHHGSVERDQIFIGKPRVLPHQLPLFVQDA